MPRQHCPEQEVNGESLSWAELQKRAVDILRSGRGRGWPPSDREDVAVEAVIRTMGAIRKGQVDMQRFDGWFYTVVDHTAIDFWEKWSGPGWERVPVPIEDAVEPDDPRTNAEFAQVIAQIDVQKLLECPSLTEDERAVIEATYWYDLSSGEIAAILTKGMSDSSVRTLHRRALIKLRAHLRGA
jgi:RNA polymerase sigma factor (sigma-70 family)